MYTIKELILLGLITLYVILYMVFKRKKRFKKFILSVIVIALFIIFGSISFNSETSYKLDYFYDPGKKITQNIALDKDNNLIISEKTTKKTISDSNGESELTVTNYTPHLYRKYLFIYTKSLDLEKINLIDYENEKFITAYKTVSKDKVYIYLDLVGTGIESNTDILVGNQRVGTISDNLDYYVFAYDTAITDVKIQIGENNYKVIGASK